MPERRFMYVAKGIRTLSAGLHLAIATAIIFGLAYLLGHKILSGQIWGNDSALHVGYAVWLNQYFPTVPHWYPQAGGGVSLLHGYPILSHLLVVAVHRLSGLAIYRAFLLISFLSFPLSALGIYMFCWSALRKQTVGLIAAVFYLLAPVTWTWMASWGFFSQQVASVFLPLALLAFDRVLKLQVERRHGGQRRIWFAALVLVFLSATVLHMSVGTAAAAGMALYTLSAALIAPRGHRKAVILGGTKILMMLMITVGLLAAAYFVPFAAYGQVANRDGLNIPAPHQLHRLPIREFFGLSAIDHDEPLTRMQFPLVVTVLALFGIVMALLGTRKGLAGSRKTLALAIVGVGSTIFVLAPSLAGLVLRMSSLLWMFVNFRSLLLLVMMLMPVMAAEGVWAFTFTVISPGWLLRGSAPKKGSRASAARGLVGPVASGLALVLAGVSILLLGPLVQVGPNHISYGPDLFDLRDAWGLESGTAGKDLAEQLKFENWPALALGEVDPATGQSGVIASLLPEGRPLRMDVSPYLGQLAQDLITYSGASQINTYTFQISLIHAMWGYQQSVFYGREAPVEEYGNPRTLNAAAQWFGTEYVFLNPQHDPVETYEAAGWDLVHQNDGLELRRNPLAPGLATASSRPAVLVIGKSETDSYMTVFRLANDGMLPYEEALLVEGQPRLDRYKLEDLQPFDALFLHGYDYKNSRKAWDILASYVQQGGSIFIDTGWEFWIPEWEFDPAPEVLPLQRLKWTDYGMTDDFLLGPEEIAGNIDVGKFNPLAWEGVPWTLSGAELSDVREWGTVVLSAAGKPLIVAGQFGQGRVVWSGMNFLAHIQYLGRNEAEQELLQNLLGWLIEGKQGDELATPSVARDDPDHIRFSLSPSAGDTTWLYWREAYYNNWHAQLTDLQGTREIPIYRAGPGFMLMPIQTGSEAASVMLDWEPALLERAALIASVLGAILVVGMLLDGLFLDGNGFTWLRIAMAMHVPSPFLGHGSNQKWAEEKRAEIIGGTSDSPQRIHQPIEAMPRFPEQRSQPPGGNSDHEPSQYAAAAKAFDLKLDEGEENLLRSWLENSEHSDDEWAEKLLNGRETGDK